MEVSLLLAKVMGVYLVVITLGVLRNWKRYMGMIGELKTSKHFSMIGGFVALIIGLLVVIYHNVWEGEFWQILITMIGWITLLKGIMYLIFPGWLINFAQKMKKSGMSVGVVLMLLIGIYLAYIGFTI